MPLMPVRQEPRAKLGILSCSHFQAEIDACIAAAAWPDVVSVAFPARCGRPPVSWDEISAVIPDGCTQLLLLGRACVAGLGEPPPTLPPVRQLVQAQCFHLIAGPGLVAEAIEGGSYLISPGWLRHWQRELEAMGFSLPQAREFFHDFSKELTLLDTGTDQHSRQLLHEMGAAVALPTKAVPVGLDYVRLFLNGLVLEWRLDTTRDEAEERQKQYARTLADHVSALDLLGQLTRQGPASQVLAGMEDLFRMLFSPAEYRFIPPTPDLSVQSLVGDGREILPELDQSYAWNANRSGFVLRLTRSDECLGFICVSDFQFPQFKEQYLNLALAMTDVCALSLESARTRKRLIEAEKMASLGVMVAGIAHEINTPVGVGALAASSLRQQTSNLAASFAARRMTQSDFQNYLEASTAATDLVASSLERVGKLIASFRRVAVGSHREKLQSVVLAVCLRDAIATFGERLRKGDHQIQLNCPESIVLEAYPGDLESVFTNLIANSLQHGFKGRLKGNICISAQQHADTVHMEYSDDGLGLSVDASQRLFDPFFTTDMQHGMGLGMHLVYNLVSQTMGGTIRVDPNVHAGVRFLIDVPVQLVRIQP